MELGLNLPYVEGSMDGRTPRWSDILGMAQTAEAIGIDALWVSDHVGLDAAAGRPRQSNGGRPRNQASGSQVMPTTASQLRELVKVSRPARRYWIQVAPSATAM